MEIFTVNCQACQKPFSYFSSTSNSIRSQICDQCRSPKKEYVMNKNESKEIDYLNQIIRLQNQIIDLLRVEVDRLKTAPTYYPPINPTPIVGPGLTTPHNPFIVPYPDPTNPFQQPITPGINPLQPPYIVTCDGQTGIQSTGNPFPNNSTK